MKPLKRLLAIILTFLGISLALPIFILSLLIYIFIGEKALEVNSLTFYLLFNPLYR